MGGQGVHNFESPQVIRQPSLFRGGGRGRSPPEKTISKNLIKKRLKYIFSFNGIIDLGAILPSILPIFFGGVDLRWLRVLRLLRLL